MEGIQSLSVVLSRIATEGSSGILDVLRYAQSTVKGHIRAKENVFVPQVKIVIHYLTHIPPLRIGEIWGK